MTMLRATMETKLMIKMTPNKRSFEKICMCTQLCLRKIDDICAPNSALNTIDDIKTFTENWDSKAPSVGTLLVYLETTA